MKRILVLGLGLIWLLVALDATAADFVLKVSEKEPPKDLDASILAKLQPKAIQLLDGDQPAYEFWFVSDLPLKSKVASAGKALEQVKDATLLGAVAVPKARRDYRDDELAPGIYTMRFALQPQDGNHLGTAEFNYFAVLVPAKLDRSPDGIADYKKLVKTSGKETASGHPTVLSLRPPASDTGDFPKLNVPAAEHKSVRVKVPARIGDGGEQASAIFEVVCEGMGHK
ncbi:MAG: hypothetical protein L0Z50_05485 [Verrucomicrobiales bacterium]|nr:hypothetical protein [Verrucomicrobiales bacterium]